jgi:flagellar biosynthesis/type III secretory pathway protein FliH
MLKEEGREEGKEEGKEEGREGGKEEGREGGGGDRKERRNETDGGKKACSKNAWTG